MDAVSDQSRTYTFNSALVPDFEIGAELFSYYAYPGLREVDQQRDAADALCWAYLKSHGNKFPESETSLRKTYPELFSMDGREFRRRLRTFDRRLRDRKIAARMALGMFSQAISGLPPSLPASMMKHTLEELANLVLSESGEKSPENIIRRAWRETKPVITLAVALQVLGRACVPDTEITDLAYPIGDGKLHCAVIEYAQLLEPCLLIDKRLRSQDSPLDLQQRWTTQKVSNAGYRTVQTLKPAMNREPPMNGGSNARLQTDDGRAPRQYPA